MINRGGSIVPQPILKGVQVFRDTKRGEFKTKTMIPIDLRAIYGTKYSWSYFFMKIVSHMGSWPDYSKSLWVSGAGIYYFADHASI